MAIRLEEYLYYILSKPLRVGKRLFGPGIVVKSFTRKKGFTKTEEVVLAIRSCDEYAENFCMMVILNAVLGYDGEPLATYVARDKN